MIEVYKNFLPQSSFDNLINTVYDIKFPWCRENIIDPNYFDKFELLCDKRLNSQFSHRLYGNHQPLSEYFDILNPFINKLRIKALVTAKINYNPVWNEVVEHIYHTDNPYNCKTAVFYLNSNDGYTAFETGEKIPSTSNMIAIFDSGINHTGTTCTDVSGRYVLNLNYFT